MTDAGRIVAYGYSRPGDMTPAGEIDLGNVAILPGLVNAHTHLELSWLRGRIPETTSFPRWIRLVVDFIRQARDHADEVERAIGDAIDEARRFGTAALGDISNELRTSQPLADRGMGAVVFHEVIGFRSENAPRIINKAIDRISRAPSGELLRHFVAAHAPYSVSPTLFAEVGKARGADPLARTSVHLGEAPAELEFLKNGSGPWRKLLEDQNAWDEAWAPPGCEPVEYLDRMGLLDDRTLVVHGVQLSDTDLRRLAEAGATLVTCPRGNTRTGAGAPPIARFYESGVRVAVGTDSLASVPDLNLFAELSEMRRLAPDVPAAALLESATLQGAQALGFAKSLGSIQPGKHDRLLAVEVPESLADVEEYLVSGVEPDRIRWLTATS